MRAVRIVERMLRARRPGIDLRSRVLAVSCWVTAASTGALTAARPDLFTAVDWRLCTVLAATAAAGLWSQVRRRLSDAECAVVLSLVLVAASATAASCTSELMRWVGVHAVAEVPLLALLLVPVRWCAVVAAVSWAGQLAIMLSVRPTRFEAVFAAVGLLYVMVALLAMVWWLWHRAERALAAAERAATHDVLTGLLNRRGMATRLPALGAAAAAGGRELGVLLVDVDHFKAINDTRGHDAGDAVLAALAEALSGALGADDLLVRLGGEEFAVVGSFEGVAAAEVSAELLRAQAGSTSRPGLPGITVSVGVATSPVAAGADASAVVSRLLSDADRALYAAKAAGRNRVVCSEPPGGAEDRAPAAAR